MNYAVVIDNDVDKSLKKLTVKTKIRIEEKLKSVAKNYPNTETFDWKKMKGEENIYRLRIGKMRFLIEVIESDMVLFVFDFGFRGDIYKK